MVVRIRMLNTDSVATASLAVADGQPVYPGTTAISGVPGSGAAIRLDFEDIAGGVSFVDESPLGDVVGPWAGKGVAAVDHDCPQNRPSRASVMPLSPQGSRAVMRDRYETAM